MENPIYLFNFILSLALFVSAQECNMFEREQERTDHLNDQEKSLWVPYPGGLRLLKQGKIIEGMSLWETAYFLMVETSTAYLTKYPYFDMNLLKHHPNFKGTTKIL